MNAASFNFVSTVLTVNYLMSKQLVLMDHDGGVDDYLATMLLMTMDNVQPFSLK